VSAFAHAGRDADGTAEGTGDGDGAGRGPFARYRVEHRTHYAYRAPVVQSWQLAHLTPRVLPWQRVRAHAVVVEPAPDARRDGLDAWGNGTTRFAIDGPHTELAVTMRGEVDVGPRPVPRPARDRPCGDVRDAVRRDPLLDGLEAARVVEPSGLVPWSEAARAYAAPSLDPRRGWLEGVTELMHRVHADFRFKPGATTVTTSVDEVIAGRAGVCQDFAHLMLAALRTHGLPARYVSGYLLTRPPPGRKRLLGADASHAWIAAYAPAHGWVEFDPTNATLADRRYITLAWGGDFADVVPLRGVLVGGRGQRMRVGVSVVPEDEAD
jgi:transglutaminase-like putative cysteine protease